MIEHTIVRKCSRCTAVEGTSHPVNNENVVLEVFTEFNGRERLVCSFCALQLESRATKKTISSQRFAFFKNLFGQKSLRTY